MARQIKIKDIVIGGKNPFVLIAGPCVIEDKRIVLQIALSLKTITRRLRIPFIFKASYDKANRTSISSFRGPGIEKGLAVLKEVKESLGLPVLSDVHCAREAHLAAKVLDVIQIPAFLCRQTDLIVAVAETGKVVNIKKGQFMAPWDMKAVTEKVRKSGNAKILLTDRGTSFGYNNLISDFRSLAIMRKLGYPVIYDATHSVQQPGGLGSVSGGQSEFIPLLSRSGVAAGCDGIFMEVHPCPDKALSDGPNMVAIKNLEALLRDLLAIDKIARLRK